MGDNLLRIEITRKTLRINFRKNVNNVKNSWKFGLSKVFSFWFSYSCSFLTKIQTIQRKYFKKYNCVVLKRNKLLKLTSSFGKPELLPAKSSSNSSSLSLSSSFSYSKPHFFVKYYKVEFESTEVLRYFCLRSRIFNGSSMKRLVIQNTGFRRKK